MTTAETELKITIVVIVLSFICIVITILCSVIVCSCMIMCSTGYLGFTLFRTILTRRRFMDEGSEIYGCLDEEEDDKEDSIDGIENENVETSLRRISSHLKSDPLNHKALLERGNLFIRIGEFQLALRDFRAYSSLQPDYYECYNRMGQIYTELNNKERALENYSKALELNPEDFDSRVNRSLLFYHFERFYEAVEDLTKVIDVVGEDAGVLYFYRARSHFRLGNFKKAVEDAEVSIRIDEKHVNEALEIKEKAKEALDGEKSEGNEENEDT